MALQRLSQLTMLFLYFRSILTQTFQLVDFQFRLKELFTSASWIYSKFNCICEDYLDEQNV